MLGGITQPCVRKHAFMLVEKHAFTLVENMLGGITQPCVRKHAFTLVENMLGDEHFSYSERRTYVMFRETNILIHVLKNDHFISCSDFGTVALPAPGLITDGLIGSRVCLRTLAYIHRLGA